jgi:hypothetical protein
MKVRGTHFGVAAAASVAAAVVALGLGTGAADAARTQPCGPTGYRLGLQALTGPAGADLTVRVVRRARRCALPRAVDVTAVVAGHRVRYAHVAASGGLVSVPLGRVARRRSVTATAGFLGLVLRGSTRVLLRPDLVFASVRVAPVVVKGQLFTVSAVVRERNRDVGATAKLTLTNGTTLLASRSVRVPAGGHGALRLAATLETVGPTALTLVIASSPAETRTDNDHANVPLEVVEFAARRAAVVTKTLAGYGSQFNENVYTAISQSAGVTEQNVGDMEAKMRALHPEFSRIFFTPAAFSNPDLMQSFIRTVTLAQSTGTNFDITWQGGRLDVASGTVQKFASVLIDLVKNRGITRFRWLTLQNEPNTTRMTPAQYATQYRQLDPYVASIRGQVRYMGGDLVNTNQQAWFDYLASHLSDLLDAYSVHIYWDFWDTAKLQRRLAEVRAIVDKLPPAGRKPVYVGEYGVRGLRAFAGAPQTDPGVWTDGTPITQTNVSAFQHAWFDILSAQLGFAGTSKWDSYFGKYDRGTQAYYMIGPPQNGWPLYPVYSVARLLTATAPRGWKVVKVVAVPGTTRLLTAYAGVNGQETVVGLDTAGAQLNGASTTQVSYSIGGLPKAVTMNLVVWNQAGDGLIGAAVPVTTDAFGAATIAVPQNAVFALTTLPAPPAGS